METKISLCIKNNVMIIFMSTGKHLYEYFLAFQSERKYTSNWRKILGIFFFFINFLMKTIIKSIIYCQTAPLDHLLMYFVKIVYRASLVSFLT